MTGSRSPPRLRLSAQIADGRSSHHACYRERLPPSWCRRRCVHQVTFTAREQSHAYAMYGMTIGFRHDRGAAARRPCW